MILGNHDKPLRTAYKNGMLDDLIRNDKLRIIGGKVALDKSILIAKVLRHDNERIVLSHYSYRSWPTAFRGTMHAFGHSHSNLSDFYKSKDVGVDTNNFYPVSFEDFIEEMHAKDNDFRED